MNGRAASTVGSMLVLAFALLGVPGVLHARASYEKGTATITVERDAPRSRPALEFAIAGIGFALADAETAPRTDRLAGRWRATSDTEDGQEFEIILDLGKVGARWVGEFDLPQFDVENYPVEVALRDSLVELHFTAMALDYTASLSADGARLSGPAIHEGEDEGWELVFTRLGEPSFSETFLRLEAVAEDTTAVRRLSSDARELRAAFNRDTDKVRLLMLLAPS